MKQYRISLISKDRKTIRLEDEKAIPKTNEEYRCEHLDVSKFQYDDRVVVDIKDGRLSSIQFPPDKVPQSTNGSANGHTPVPSTSQPTPAANGNGTKEKWTIALLQKGTGKALIRQKTGKEEWLTFSGKAEEKITRLQDGQLVRLKLDTETNFYDINPVDEEGEYDKSAWGNGKGKRGWGGGYKPDPTIELIKNFSILNESVFDKAEKWAECSVANNLTPEQRDEGWSWIEQAVLKTSLKIYREVEKKHRVSEVIS
ncbi:MAG: hypothetical protein JXA44_04050 [Methanospirillaceae archaeon]|nr:hypothetical protein [Methanospirillaceae archaeon]